MFKPKGTIMENLDMVNAELPDFDKIGDSNRAHDVLKWGEQISSEYEICFAKDLFDVKRLFGENAIISPLRNDYNHIIAVVFSNAEIDGKVTEFFLDKNGLHFYDYPFKLRTKEYGIQVHTVYRSENETLAWVQTKAFHKGNTYFYERYIMGSEKPFPYRGEDFETIYHG